MYTRHQNVILIVQCNHQKKAPEKIAATLSTSTNNKWNYKKNLTYDASWKKEHSWMNYDSTLKGMVCTVCKIMGKVPVQAKGA